MTISSLRITNFRNLASVELAPSLYGMNIFLGDNGSGKTSLLESIFYLGLGRSFRSSSPARMIRQTADQFSIFSQLLSEALLQIPLGVERDMNGYSRFRLAEKDVSGVSELAALLPILLINSHSHNLFESGPVFRRKFLDWGLFYQFDTFLPCWRQFERVLRQRNAVLRDRRPLSELRPWSDELVKYGLELDGLRRQYVAQLIPVVSELTNDLLGIGPVQFDYQAGWETEGDNPENYASILTNALSDEIRSGHTLYGPHRADLAITIDGVPVRHFLSRGQQKLLICAMIVAQGRLLSIHANKRLIYLVDDLPAELDLLSRHKLISLMTKQQAQIFITAIEHETIFDLLKDNPDVPVKVFHVKHGNVSES